MSSYKSCEIFFSHSNDYIVIASGLFGVALRLLSPCMWTKIFVLTSMLQGYKIEHYSSSVKFLEIVTKSCS